MKYNSFMEKEHTLTVRLSPLMMRLLDNYCKPRGLTYTEAFRCCIVNFEGESNPVDVQTGIRETMQRLERKLEGIEKRLEANRQRKKRGEGAQG